MFSKSLSTLTHYGRMRTTTQPKEPKTVIVVVHGFAGAGMGDKYMKLTAKYSKNEEIKVISPSFSHVPSEAIVEIDEIVQKYKKKNLIFIGTSLGGFYANYAHRRYGVKSILINPVTDPRIMMLCVGTRKSYGSGEEFTFTADDVEYLVNLEAQVRAMGDVNKDNCYVFVGRQDMLLDSEATKKYFAGYLLLEVDADHRFTNKFHLVMYKVDEMME